VRDKTRLSPFLNPADSKSGLDPALLDTLGFSLAIGYLEPGKTSLIASVPVVDRGLSEVRVSWGYSVGGGDLALDGGVVASIAGIVTVEQFVLPAEPGLDSAQRGLRAGQMCTLLGRPASVLPVEAALATVLLALAFVCESLTRVGSTVSGLGTGGPFCLFGGPAFVCGMLALKLGGAFVVLLRLAVHRSGLAMELRQLGSCLCVGQPLAAFGGGAFGAGVFARSVAELSSTLGALTMLVGGNPGHGAGAAHFPRRLRVARGEAGRLTARCRACNCAIASRTKR
jgi:hypothetical protein